MFITYISLELCRIYKEYCGACIILPKGYEGENYLWGLHKAICVLSAITPIHILEINALFGPCLVLEVSVVV